MDGLFQQIKKLKEKESKSKTTNTAIKIVPKVAERVEEARWLVERFIH